MTNLLITVQFIQAVADVEGGQHPRKTNWLNFKPIGWTYANNWRKQHGQTVYPFTRKYTGDMAIAKAVARSYFERAFEWAQKNHYIAFDRAINHTTLYLIFRHGPTTYARWHSVPDAYWQRAMNVARLAEKFEKEEKVKR